MTKTTNRPPTSVLRSALPAVLLLVASGAAHALADGGDTTTLHADFPGMSSVHTEVRLPDDTPGTASGRRVAASWWKSDATSVEVEPGVYDVLIRQGGASRVYDDVDCTGTVCSVHVDAAQVEVLFDGMSSVHTQVRVTDGVAGTADGDLIARANWKSQSALIHALPGTYDLRVTKGAQTIVIDDLTCPGGPCTVDLDPPTLRVDFDGFSSVHTRVLLDDGIAGSAEGDKLLDSNWKRDFTEVRVLPGIYDLLLRKGSAEVVLDAVDCSNGDCEAALVPSELEVRFPGLWSVHTDVRVDDEIGDSATGGRHTNSGWKADSTLIPVFPGVFDVLISKGEASFVVDAVDCTGGYCEAELPVATLDVAFAGLRNVHTSVHMPDAVDNEATGSKLTASNWKTDGTRISLFPAVYDVLIRQGSVSAVFDEVDCGSGVCAVDLAPATLDVAFPGLSPVHTYVNKDDGIAGSATGDTFASSTWKSDSTSFKVFPTLVDLDLRHRASRIIVDALDCSGERCSASIAPVDLRVLFDGLSSVHTRVLIADGTPGEATGERVTDSNWKTNETSIELLPGDYDLLVRHGGASIIVDDVHCAADSGCLVDLAPPTMQVLFDGLSSVHTEVRLADGAPGTAEGERVTRSRWKTNQTAIRVLPGDYDLFIRHGGASMIIDDVHCTADAGCQVDLAPPTLQVLFDGLSPVHTDVRLDDGAIGSAAGEHVTRSNWKRDSTSVRVLPGVYDLYLRLGAASMVIDGVDCSAGDCVADARPATLAIAFPDMRSVHTEVLVDTADGSGERHTRRNWQNGSTEIRVFRQQFDLRLRKGPDSILVQNVDCTSGSCSVDGLIATLDISFPGLRGVHSSVHMPDGIADSADPDALFTKANWRNQQTLIPVFRHHYDLLVRHAVEEVFDDVDCTSGSCSIEVSGNVQARLVDGNGTPLVDKWLTAYEKLADGTLRKQQYGRTSADGRVHFTLPDLDAGSVYVLRTWNAFDRGKNYYSPLITSPGPIQFQITPDGNYPLDTTPPSVAIGSPAAGSTVSTSGFDLSGSAADNNELAGVQVTVAGAAGSTTQAVQVVGGQWLLHVSSSLLSAGPINIQAVAEDRARNQASARIGLEVIADSQPPSIAIDSHVDGEEVPETGLLLSGLVSDETGVAGLWATLDDSQLGRTIDAREVAVSSNGAFTLAVQAGQISAGSSIQITLEAADGDGNLATAGITLAVKAADGFGQQMINRITFGATPELLQLVDDDGALAFLDMQLNPADIDDSALEDALAEVDPTTLEELKAWQLTRMVYSQRQLNEVMTWFWENHFNTDINTKRNDADGVEHADSVAYELEENRLFRENALGNFQDLLWDSATSPAMLIYLDSISNVAADSNENYAREVMELHTLGVNGGYSDADVAGAAELFTGWGVQNGYFHFDEERHNPAGQTVYGLPFPPQPPGLGPGRGLMLLSYLARHPQTAEFICTKLVTLFVSDEPPTDLVERCATSFVANYSATDQIALVLREILTSPEFAEAQRNKIKTPIELVAGALRNLSADSDGSDLAAPMASMGLKLFEHPVPTGFSEVGSDWISSSQLIERIKWVNALARSEPTSASAGTWIDPVDLFASRGFETAEGIVHDLFRLTLADDYGPVELAQALAALNRDDGFDIADPSAEQRLRELIGIVLSYPQFQLQ